MPASVEAVERSIAVIEEPSIQRNPTELAELAILDRDIFADTPPDIRGSRLPLNDLQSHRARV
jgi:hypothetical protein